jgi:Tfp pilus assembly protein PilF
MMGLDGGLMMLRMRNKKIQEGDKPMLRMSLRTAVMIVLFFAMILSSSAQLARGKGRIRGTTIDTAGNPLPGVTITAVHTQSGTAFKGKSDKKGKWAIAGLGTGQFQLTAELDGYGPVQHDMRISQFSKNNPPIQFALQKIQTQGMGLAGLEDSGAVALFEEGNRLYNDEKFAEAAAKFTESLEKNPTFFQVNINLGNCYRGMEEYDKAIAAFTVVLEKVREEKGTIEGSEAAARALAALGETNVLQGDLDQASANLQQAMALFPDDEVLAFNIGEIYFTQGDAAGGIEYFDKAVELRPDWAPPYRQRGYAKLNQADYKGALESFRKFLELAPDDRHAPTIRALIPQLETLIKK